MPLFLQSQDEPLVGDVAPVIIPSNSASISLVISEPVSSTSTNSHCHTTASTTTSLTAECPPLKSNNSNKRKKVTTQDIQKMQMEILKLEKEKIALEVENMKLMNKKLKIELQQLEASCSD